MLCTLVSLCLLAQTATAPRVVLVGLDGGEHLTDPAKLDTRDPRELGAWRVRFESASAPPIEREAARARLWSGERVIGAVKGGRQESLVLQTAGGVGLVLELEELDELRFPARIPDLWSRPLEPAAEGDRLYRRSREALDVLEGGIESFSADGLSFRDARVGEKSIPWSEVAALFVDRAAGKEHVRKPPAGVPVVIDLVDGGRLRGGLAHLGARGVELQRERGERLELPLETLLLVALEDPRQVFLSDLAPAEAAPAAPFGDDLGMRWPQRVDGCVTGSALRAGGRRWARGLGMHAPGRAVWKLEPGWKSLHGAVAIDDNTAELAARGSVAFRVLLDGRVAWQSELVRGGDAPRALPDIALGQARELALEVTDGGDGFSGDRADWLELTLTR